LLLFKAYSRQGSFTPRELPRFIATMSPSESRLGSRSTLCISLKCWVRPTLSGLSVSDLLYRHALSPTTPVGPNDQLFNPCYVVGTRLQELRHPGHPQWRNEAESSITFCYGSCLCFVELQTADYSNCLSTSLHVQWAINVVGSFHPTRTDQLTDAPKTAKVAKKN
jgi:hypothetical protein